MKKMTRSGNLSLLCGILLTLSIPAALSGSDKEWRPSPPEAYKAKQTIDHVTIAAQVFESDEHTKPVFGKRNPYKYGVLPVLVVIHNGSGETLRLEDVRFQYVTIDRESIEPTAATDVRFVTGPNRPRIVPGPIPGTSGVSRKKGPLTDERIEQRAFAAKMLPPGETASGFVYFQTHFRSSSTLLVTGLKQAASGRDLFFFEIPLAEAQQR